MISTVTTAVSSITISTLARSFAMIVLIVFIYLMIQKEIVRESNSNVALQRLNKALDIVIVPLALGFIAVIAVELLGYF